MQKKITRLEHPRQHHMVGDGFRVAQYIPGYGREMSDETSPFLMLDYNAPWRIEPQGGHRPGVGFHPHRGFETVTIVYSGEVEHQDTAGNGGIIGADEVQWMTAGSGLLHNEFMTDRFSITGGIQHAVQLWVNLPREYKMVTPRYQALTRDSIPEVVFDGGKVRVIAGELEIQDAKGIVRNQSGIARTYSPVELYDIRFFYHSEGNGGIPLDPDISGKIDINQLSEKERDAYGMTNIEKSSITLTFPEGYTTMILVTEGSIIANGKTLENGDMLHFSREGTEVVLESSASAKILVMAGKPLGEPIAQYGPFVMNTQSEIMQAFADLRDGKMGVEPKNYGI